MDMYYHATFVLKSTGVTEVLLDLTHDEVRTVVLDPLSTNRPILVKGRLLRASDLERFTITSTSTSGHDYVQKIVLEQRARGVELELTRAHSLAASQGSDITQEFTNSLSASSFGEPVTGEPHRQPATRPSSPLDPVLRGFTDALAKAAPGSDVAELIVKRAGFPHEHIPKFETAQLFWSKIVEEAMSGRLGLSALAAEALSQLPWNATLREHKEKLEQATKDRAPRRILVIHGGDEPLGRELEAILLRRGLGPITLSAEVPREALATRSPDAEPIGHIVVLLTPEFGRELPNAPASSRRPSQAVVFALGYFLGKLDRARVCCVRRGPLDLPDDVRACIDFELEHSITEIETRLLDKLTSAETRSPITNDN